MINLSINELNNILAFWLIFTRCLGIIIQLPIFNNQSVFNPLKFLFTLILTYSFYPFVKGILLKEILEVGSHNFIFLTIYHLLVGLIIGFLVRSILSLFISTGSIMTQQMGFGAVRYFDPNAFQQIGPLEKIIQLTMLIVIISSGALLPMFKATFLSFESINIFTFDTILRVPKFYFYLFKNIFISSFILATPIIFMNILIAIIMGIVSRFVPQMNILIVSFSIYIGVCLFLFYMISNEFFHYAYKVFLKYLGDWFQFVT